ncbi:zinc ribbon domain-containing protein [Cohnella candidum]|uniref:PEGA domain-containing protein n=1 Tax=Cohnella candidum TaxID=2674991 RepID=A0A3G3K4B4_9BACL|nr:hypothetical protein [Cohnella candidum]AYQ75333.1 hypothetical protein EAV92_23995 [Cohnella candidum]
MNRKKVWAAGGAAALILLAAGLYLFGRWTASESRTVRDFESALRGGDTAKVASMLVTDNDKAKMDEAAARTLLAYLKQDGRLDQAMKELSGSETGIFSVEKNGRQYVLFDRYRVVVHTGTVEARTNYNGAAIKLNGKTVATADSDDYSTQIGPLLPGNYKLEAVFAGDYATLKTEQTVTVNGGGNSAESVDLSLQGEMVTIDANYPQAKIFIDDKDTGALTGGNDSLGPVSTDGSNLVHVEKEFPWGTAKSKPQPITGSSVHVELDPNDDALKDSVMLAASNFIESWMEAYNLLDPAVLKNSSADKKAGLEAGVEDYKKNGLRYESRLKKIVFDTDSIYVQQDSDGSFRTAVSVQSTYDQRFYAAGDTPPAYAEYTDTMTYRLVYEKGEWIVADWYQDYGFQNAHTKTMSYSS